MIHRSWANSVGAESGRLHLFRSRTGEHPPASSSAVQLFRRGCRVRVLFLLPRKKIISFACDCVWCVAIETLAISSIETGWGWNLRAGQRRFSVEICVSHWKKRIAYRGDVFVSALGSFGLLWLWSVAQLVSLSLHLAPSVFAFLLSSLRSWTLVLIVRKRISFWVVIFVFLAAKLLEEESSSASLPSISVLVRLAPF